MKFDYHRKKTFTNYWNNCSTEPKKYQYISNIFKNLKKNVFKLLGFKISIKISNNKIEIDHSFISFQTDVIMKKYRNKLITEQLVNFLSSSNLVFTIEELDTYINDFDNVFYKSPIKELESGFGYK